MIGTRDRTADRRRYVTRTDALAPRGGRRQGHTRRARRGVAALSAVLMGSALLSSVVLAWQLREVASQQRAEAGLVIAAAEDAGFALHHWLHDYRELWQFQEPAPGVARPLNASEELSLESSAAWSPWTRLPGGWSLEAWVTTLNGQSDRELPHGVLLLVADATVNAAARNRVESHFGTGSGAEDWQQITRESDGTPLVPSDAIAVAAWTQSRLDPAVVFRGARAGHPEQGMAVAIDLGGHDIRDAAAVSMTTGVMDLLVPRISLDDLTVSGRLVTSSLIAGANPVSLVANGSLTAQSISLSDASQYLSANRLAAASLDASGSELRDLEHLVICADVEAGNCVGGNLNLTDTAAGIVVSNTLSAAGTVTARTTAEVGALLAVEGAATDASAKQQSVTNLNTCTGANCSWN